MPVIVEFKECAECAAKSGSPTLCASCLHNRRVIGEFQAHLQAEQKAKAKPGRRDPKQFRINRLRVSRINIDSEPSEGMRQMAERQGRDGKDEFGDDIWSDLVISIVDEGGNKFEVERVVVKRDGIVGFSTATAKLIEEVSWDTEEDDDSVSCALCHFQGHGAGACPR